MSKIYAFGLILKLILQNSASSTNKDFTHIYICKTILGKQQIVALISPSKTEIKSIRRKTNWAREEYIT